MQTVQNLIEAGYQGCSVRSIMTDETFRKKVLEDKTVRGNDNIKKLVMDKLAVGGKVLLTGPTGEAKTLFARVLLNHLTHEINDKKYHIKGSPFLEDAGYLIKVINHYNKNIYGAIDVLQSLSPFARATIEETLSEGGEPVNIDNTEQMVKLGKKVPELLKKVPVEKTIVRTAQIDPRNDPDSLYMLLAGVENLEQLFGDTSNTTFDPKAHKVGTLSQGFLVVNEIQRLHLSLLESLMGFLEDPEGIKYNLSGQPVYVDGAIIFTSNSPLTVFGEESQPIINRIPEVLWPARNVEDRIKIVKDMFEEHLIIQRANIVANPSLIRMFELMGEGKNDFVSRLAVEFVAHLASESIPNSLKNLSGRSENKVARAEFYAGLDEVHNPQRSPYIDLRTLNNAIGEVVIRADEDKRTESNIITLDNVKATLELYDISPTLVNNAIQSLKLNLREHLRAGGSAISVEEVTEELDKLTAMSEEQLKELVLSYEGIEQLSKEAQDEIYGMVKPSYESLLDVAYL